MNKLFMRLLFLRKLSKYTSDLEGFFGRLILLLSTVPAFCFFILTAFTVANNMNGNPILVGIVAIFSGVLGALVAVFYWLVFANLLAKIINWLING